MCRFVWSNWHAGAVWLLAFLTVKEATRLHLPGRKAGAEQLPQEASSTQVIHQLPNAFQLPLCVQHTHLLSRLTACICTACSVCCLLPVPLQTLVSNNVSLSLSSAVTLAAAQQPLAVTRQQQEAVLDFVGRRLEQLLSDAGASAEAGKDCERLYCVSRENNDLVNAFATSGGTCSACTCSACAQVLGCCRATICGMWLVEVLEAALVCDRQ